jgi:hypothetical protein
VPLRPPHLRVPRSLLVRHQLLRLPRVHRSPLPLLSLVSR